jgi:hypothetical protein
MVSAVAEGAEWETIRENFLSGSSVVAVIGYESSADI